MQNEVWLSKRYQGSEMIGKQEKLKQYSENPRVGGSNPPLGTTLLFESKKTPE
jgi:hypothetical protein